MPHIEYVDYVGQSKGTAYHPHYQSILNNPPDGWHFAPSPSVQNERIYNGFLDDFRADCGRRGRDHYHVQHFISKIHPGAKSVHIQNDLSLSPTLPYIGPVPNLLVLEDWSDIFTFLMTGPTQFVSLQEPYFDIMGDYMSRPHFKGIITHMKATIGDLETIFKNRINDKLFYLPIGHEDATKLARRVWTGERLKVLVTNSYGAPEGNSYVRGSVEAVRAVTNLIGRGLPIDLTILGPTPREIQAMCKNNVAIHPHFIDEATMTSIIEEVDVFLIPSMRVHSISVVRAMCNNVVPVVSDGWGFDEFVKHGETGIDCAGQLGFTSFNDDIFRSNYDVRSNSQVLTQNIEHAIGYLVRNPDALKRMSAKAKNYAVETFDIKQRNKRLGEILTHVYTN